MKFLLTIGLVSICIAAGSGQTAYHDRDKIPDSVKADIKIMADSIAKEAANQVDSIMETKKNYPRGYDDVQDPKTWRIYRHQRYYNLIRGKWQYKKVTIKRIL